MHVGRGPVAEVADAVKFIVLLDDCVPESKVCEVFELSDELVTLPSISPLLMLNMVVDPMVVVIVVEALVMVESRGDVEMATED